MTDNGGRLYNYLVMNWQELLDYVDKLLFSQTGQHLDDLQSSILKGVLENQKYKQIAEQCYRTEGHVKDEAYELWKKLSETLGEDVNKSNFRATIQRNVITNSTFTVHGNPIGSINLCPNSSQSSSLGDSQTEPAEPDKEESLSDLKRKVKLDLVANLAQLGLTAEQIAQSLSLSLDDVLQRLSENK